MARTKRRSATIRAVAVVPPLHCVALCHVGDRRYSPGPPLRPAGCRARLNRRTIAAVASLDAARRVGETRSRWSACGSGRVRSLRPGPQGRALAGTARLGFVYSAARSPTKLVPLKRLHGRRRFAPARAGLRCATPTVAACGAPGIPAPETALLRRCASLEAPCPTPRPLTRPSRHSLRLAILRGLAPRARTSS